MVLVCTQVNAGGWPKLPLPKNVKVTTVGEELLVNGMPMRVVLFTSSQSNTEVATFYMNLWESTNVSENRLVPGIRLAIWIKITLSRFS